MSNMDELRWHVYEGSGLLRNVPAFDTEEETATLTVGPTDLEPMEIPNATYLGSFDHDPGEDEIDDLYESLLHDLLVPQS